MRFGDKCNEWHPWYGHGLEITQDGDDQPCRVEARTGVGAGARSGRLNVQAGLKRLNRRSSAVRQGGCVHRAMLKA